MAIQLPLSDDAHAVRCWCVACNESLALEHNACDVLCGVVGSLFESVELVPRELPITVRTDFSRSRVPTADLKLFLFVLSATFMLYTYDFQPLDNHSSLYKCDCVSRQHATAR